MYDTVCFNLSRDEAKGIELLSEIPCYLDNVAEHNYSGTLCLTGDLKGLHVSITENRVKVSNSLCKWFLGDNYQTMGRSDAHRAIQKLSETLHLPIERADVTRLDIAQNYLTRYPVDVYLSHLGALNHTSRLVQPTGLYYKQADRQLCFYDKNREQRSKRQDIPELYRDRNVLRYEQRYTQRLSKHLGVPKVTGALLYDEAFYIDLLSRYRDTYKAIQKINDISLNTQFMKTKKDFYKAGVLAMVEKAGGEIQMLDQIKEAQERGELTKKQAFDIRAEVKAACKIKAGLTVQNEAIKELDQKVIQAIKYYR